MAVPKAAVNRPAARLSGPIVLLTNPIQALPGRDRLMRSRSVPEGFCRLLSQGLSRGAAVTTTEERDQKRQCVEVNFIESWLPT